MRPGDALRIQHQTDPHLMIAGEAPGRLAVIGALHLEVRRGEVVPRMPPERHARGPVSRGALGAARRRRSPLDRAGMAWAACRTAAGSVALRARGAGGCHEAQGREETDRRELVTERPDGTERCQLGISHRINSTSCCKRRELRPNP